MSRRGAGPIAALLAAAIVAGGCGYTLRPSLPAHIKTLHVPVLENRTREPGIEDLVTQAVIEAFVTSGQVRIADSAARADAVLEGAIIGYTLTALAFDRTANATQYRLQIALALTLHDRQQSRVLWRHSRLEERADFQVAGAVSQTIAREDQALRQAALDISRAIVSLALEGF